MRPLPLILAGLALGALTVALLPARVLFRDHGHVADAGTGERYACPMMDYLGWAPGPCPVCGMQMTKVVAGELSREQQRRMGLATTAAVSAPALATVRASGLARYDLRAATVVVPRIAGRVVKRHAAALHPGELVAAGDPLVDLYSPEMLALQGELAAARALAATDPDRGAALVAAIRARFERLHLGAVAEAVAAGGAPQDTVTIRSPAAGRVVVAAGMAEVQVGQELAADAALVSLVDPAAFMVVLVVPEVRARWLRPGQAAALASDDAGELPEVAAAVSWVAPEIRSDLRTREVHLHLRDPHGRILAGALVRARIRAALGPDLGPADPADPATWGRFVQVPRSAVLSTGTRDVAWRVARRHGDGRLEFALAPLALGPRLEDPAGEDRLVVRAGLAAGDEVATSGLFLVDSQAQLAGTPSLLLPDGAAPPAPAHRH